MPPVVHELVEVPGCRRLLKREKLSGEATRPGRSSSQADEKMKRGARQKYNTPEEIYINTYFLWCVIGTFDLRWVTWPVVSSNIG